MASTPGTDDGRTPLRAIRIPDEVWRHAQEVAALEGISVSAYIVDKLRRWRPKAPRS